MSRRPTEKRLSASNPHAHALPRSASSGAIQPIGGGGASKRAASALAPGLYVTATPIGNAADITLRAREVLGAVNLIACEDTRHTGKLLKLHNIVARLTPYHEHNAERVRPHLIARLLQGEAVALVSDAGTPLVSDPGYRLVRECIAQRIPVTALPGPSAALAALVVSGLPTDRFLFAGFLPARDAARRSALAELADVPATLVILESPHRLAASLAAMAQVLGDRDAAVARELTKLYEEVRRGSLAELAAHYAATATPKGEVVVVVGPPRDLPATDFDAIDGALRSALVTMSLRDAVAHVAGMTGVPRGKAYARALALRRADEEDPG
jgi:16S rRNA (cytidine1402-2'-O)-methyltransferase